MNRLTLLLGIMLCFTSVSAQTPADHNSVIPADTALLNIYKQLMVFLQEKIYIQTDKPYYKAGETVHYRLFLMDACYHVPFSMSRYVYIEPVDRNNSVEVRQKLRPEDLFLQLNGKKQKVGERTDDGVFECKLKLTDVPPESELKGRITNPACYFSDADGAAADADLLMMTHGWTRYDITGEALKDETPDRRSTVYWKPDLVFDKDRKASVEFYTADPHTTYSVVTEGISPRGTLIYKHEKAVLKVER